MNNTLLILLFIFILYFIFFESLLLQRDEKKQKKITYFTDGSPGRGMNIVLNDYNFVKVDNDGDFFFTHNYNPCEQTAKSLVNSKCKYMGVTEGCDIIGSKIALWKVLKNKYGNDASKIMPKTYLYENENDINELKKEIETSTIKKIYVLKNYNQRQEGIKLVNSWDDIISKENKEKFLLIQQYLYDPLIISKRKVNCRVYFLTVCKNDRLYGYIYYNGFMYYTPEFYDPESLVFDKHITTGYIDRKVYDENPLTLEDLRNYLGKDKTDLFDRNLKQMMNKLLNALKNYMCQNKDLQSKIRFQIYGVDIAPTSNLDIFLMEVNKGPDLNPKDSKDSDLKINMQSEILKVLFNLHDSQKFIEV